MKDALTPPSPDDNGHPFAEARRRFYRGPSEASVPCLLAELSSSSLDTLRRTKSALGSLVFLPVYPSSSTVPPPPPSPRAIRWYSVSPCAPITRRNAHLVRGGGPIMVSNHSKLLSTRGFSAKAWATLSAVAVPHALEFLIRLHYPPTTNLPESTFDQRLRLARRCRRLAFLITVMVHATEVETPIVRWRLRC